MRSGLRLVLTFFGLCAALLSLMGPARAGGMVRQAGDPIVDRATQTILGGMPDSGTDLPSFLRGQRDVYLLVTAGAGYADVRVLAQSSADPETLARALQTAAAGTPLADDSVEWSADSYAAASLKHKTRHWGRSSGGEAVPIGALIAGLLRAGYTAHPLLRVPRYAQAVGLPPVAAGTARYRWYDGHALAHAGTVFVRARLQPRDLWPFALPLLIPLFSLACFAFALRTGRMEHIPLEARRKRFHSLSMAPLFGMVLGMPLMAFLMLAPASKILADLWWGDSTAAILIVPFVLVIALPTVGVLVAVKKHEVRLFGKPDTAAQKHWLSDDEKALQKRMQKWTTVPHLLGGAAAAAALFLVPHRSPLYSAVHPLSQFLMIGGAGLVPLLFRKQTAALTRKTVDDDLTFRARRFGPLLGARPREVWVEDSSRASHFIGAYREKDHIVVSRKLRDEFSPAETDFVLAQHVALMARRRGLGDWYALIGLLPVLAMPCVVIMMRHSSSGSASLILSPWFFPLLFVFPVLSVLPLLTAARRSAKVALDRAMAADRKALEATGNLAAALAALSKLEVLPPNLGTGTSASTRTDTLTKDGQRLLRRTALERASGELHLAPAPKMPSGVSSFARQAEGGE